MRGRFSAVIAGFALAVGGGVAGAVVVAPSLQSDADSIAVRQAAEKEALASLQHTFHVATKARGMARGARELGDGLVDEVEQALGVASNALNQANAVDARLDSTRPLSKTESSTVTTGETSNYVPLGGPEITATVPASGLIQVWASVRFGSPTDGAVALFEDGQLVPVPGQGQACTAGGLDDALLVVEFTSNPSDTMTVGTPPADLGSSGAGCGTLGGAPGSMLFERPPGTHTYELRYADCGCDAGQSAVFSNRTLRVAPLP